MSNVWFGFFVELHINFRGLSNAKSVLYKESSGTKPYLRNKVRTFPKGTKVNVIVQQEFELTTMLQSCTFATTPHGLHPSHVIWVSSVIVIPLDTNN